MAQLIVRDLDEDLKARLKQRATAHGHSMEEEVRQILRGAVCVDLPVAGLGSRIAARFARKGLPHPLPELRGQPATPARFDS